MKSTKLFLTAILLFVLGFAQAQSNYNPWKKYGYTPPKALTLSNGKYQEFFDNDTIVQIGSVMFNTVTNQIVSFVVYDTIYSEATLEPHVISRWLSPDPMAKERPEWTPYNFCRNNPILNIDPTGALDAPIYNPEGELMGTDDQGLQGKAIVMNESNFTQGMKHEDALKSSLGYQGLKNNAAKSNFSASYNSLSSRPDYDGSLTKSEADAWWQKGNEKPLFVNMAKIDLPGVTVKSFDSKNYYSENFIWGLSNTGKVYGTLDMTLLNPKTGDVKIGYRNPNVSPNGLVLDRYDFTYDGRMMRDFATWVGKPSGNGKAFDIHGYGTAKVPLK